MPFPRSLKVITNDKGELFLEHPNEIIRTSCKCMSKLSVAFAAADDVKEMLTNLISNKAAAVKIDLIKNI